MLMSRKFDIVLVRAGKAVPFDFDVTADKSVTYDGAAQSVTLP
jgi:hypothetical protein